MKELCGILGCVLVMARRCIMCNLPLCNECWHPIHETQSFAVDYPARTKATPMKKAR